MFAARCLLAFLVVQSGCAAKETFVYGADVHLNLRQLRETGAASVTVHERIDGKIKEPATETIQLGQSVEIAGESLPLADLVLHCPDDPAAPANKTEVCLLLSHHASELVLRAHRHTEAAHIGESIGAGFLALGGVGSVVCGIACESPLSTASWITLGGLLIIALASCIHSTTCHD